MIEIEDVYKYIVEKFIVDNLLDFRYFNVVNECLYIESTSSPQIAHFFINLKHKSNKYLTYSHTLKAGEYLDNVIVCTRVKVDGRRKSIEPDELLGLLRIKGF